MKKLLLISMLVVVLAACVSTEKLLEKGDYETLITKTTKKLAGRSKKPEYVLALEDGYNKLSSDLLIRIENYKKTNTTVDWERIITIVNSIEKVQNKIKPLLPLVAESGYKANFEMINTIALRTEAKTNAAQLYNIKLEILSPEARLGNKAVAREIVYIIDRINNLSDKYDYGSLRGEMKEMGTINILLTLEDHIPYRIPHVVKEEFYKIPVPNDYNKWTRYYTHFNEDLRPDFKVKMAINDLYISREDGFRNERDYSKEIRDGWEIVRDNNGIPMTDSTGNEIKKEKWITVKATTIETTRYKDATLRGTFEILHLKTGEVNYSRPMAIRDRASHTARKIYGDNRALNSNNRIEISRIDLPYDVEIMLNLMNKVKYAFTEELRNFSFIF